MGKNRNKFIHSKNLQFLFLLIILSSLIIVGCEGCGGGGSNSNNKTSPGKFVTLSWDPPTTNADGTPLADLAGFRIYYGLASRNYSWVIDVGNVTTYKIENLSPNTYYFAVTAYDTSGNESDYSNEVSKIIK